MDTTSDGGRELTLLVLIDLSREAIAESVMLSDHKRVRSFGDGPVGLRIVAAMSGDPEPAKAPPRSDPIPIRPAVGPTAKEEVAAEEEEGEGLSESYTCVTTRAGGRAVRMRVYWDGGSECGSGGAGGNYGKGAGVFSESPAGDVGHGLGFLNRCYLCRKNLHGLDIFMYRGDKAFCSVECRYQQILSDEHKEKRRSEPAKPLDCSASPCPSPLLFATGVAAA